MEHQNLTRPASRKVWLSTRDLINVGIFSALYFVIMFSTGLIGFVAPVLMFVGWTVGILLNGMVIALYLARTPRFGALTLMALIISVLTTVMGHSALMIPVAVTLGLFADLIFQQFRNRPALGLTMAYMVWSLWLVGPLVPILLNAKEYFDGIAKQMGAEYASTMADLFQPWLIGVWACCILLLAIVGGVVGARVAKTHFSRAGLA